MRRAKGILYQLGRSRQKAGCASPMRSRSQGRGARLLGKAGQAREGYQNSCAKIALANSGHSYQIPAHRSKERMWSGVTQKHATNWVRMKLKNVARKGRGFAEVADGRSRDRCAGAHVGRSDCSQPTLASRWGRR